MIGNKMTPREIVETTAIQTGDKELRWEALSVDDAYKYFNYVYLGFWGDIEDLDKSIEQKTWSIDAESGQYEYAIIEPDSSKQLFGMGKPDKVYVKQSSVEDYKEYSPIDQTNLKNDFAYLALYQSKSNPLYLKRDRSIMLFPAPTESLSSGIIVYGSPLPFKVDSSMSEQSSVILVPGRFHDTLVVGLKQWFYGARGSELTANKNEAKAEYRDEKRIALAKMITDNTEPVQGELDDDIYTLE